MSGCVGHMDTFDSTVEDWTTYVERVEQYCLANERDEGRGKLPSCSVLWVQKFIICSAASLLPPNWQTKPLMRSQKS